MSKRSSPYGPTDSIGDAFSNVLDTLARFLFWGGLVAILGAAGLLMFTYNGVANGGILDFKAANFNIEVYQKILIGGVVASFVGSTYKFWGEETLAIIQLGVGAAMFFGTPFIPSFFGSPPGNESSELALTAIRNGGIVMLALGLVTLIADLVMRARDRAKEGARADLMKYGKGVKEEREYQNVFMGKCWQLPFCRKFVRERCPIYHSKRTCWKEQVGCMCEEQVIRDAMENKAIPKDALAASSYIPVNNKLTVAQKKERCNHCVIFNEHQKHKYKLALPVTALGFVGIYIVGRQPLLDAVSGVINSMDRMVGRITISANQPDNVGRSITQSGLPFHEIMLVCIMLIMFAYALKMIEYAIFRLKV